MIESNGALEYNEQAEELIERYDVKDSPFTILKVEGKCFGVMGKYRVTDPMNSIEEVENELKDLTWNRIIQVIMICLDQRENLVNLIKEEEEL